MADATTNVAATGKRKQRVGEVVSNKMTKTIVVRVERRFPHPQYKKIVTSYKKFYAHDEKAEARIGDGYLLPVMAVVVMGGTSLAGGQGNLVGTLVAALIMAVIHNGMNILAVPAIWQSLVVGLLIIGSVLADQWLRTRA